ncbi:MAG: cyclopropane-fatty-acyl-phospholipid synthase family protein [Rhodobacteraceae bacterium]|nr:cyclopropane-fatty-acyl-phospholipid synthase family protein [Paracoccaceae bacterium]
MWSKPFDKMMQRLIRRGALRVTYPDGSHRRYGEETADAIEVTVHDNKTLRRLCLDPELALGEAYMDASFTIRNDRLEDLLRLVLRNRGGAVMPAWVRGAQRVRFHARRLLQRNTARSARARVAHHYDLSDDLYRQFLDADMQYSCGYFARPNMTLDQAQAAKKAHIAAKLLLSPGDRVLDIGCGWGGMAITLARDYGARVTGVTLSENQLDTARARVDAAGLGDRITLRLQDYRDLDEPFDRVVSVGMLEHVGVPHYRAYFARIAELLTPDGIALIHTIGRAAAPPQAHSPWIHRYIFPGGYVPSLSELAGPIEASGLWQCDIEIWRLHYARTLRHWLANFDAARDTVRKSRDDRFVRMWRYYLIACILSFEEQAQAVYQFQLARKRDAVPLTRDYLYPPRTWQARAAG